MNKTAFYTFALGLTLGWVLAYLRLPNLQAYSTFYIGLFGGFVIWILILLTARSVLKIGYLNKKSLLLCVVTLLVFVTLLTTMYSKHSLVGSLEQQNKQLIESSTLRSFQHKSNQNKLLVDRLLTELRKEYEQQQSISDKRLIALELLNNTFEPYPIYTSASKRALNLSPERGFLLAGLIALDLDSLSFSAIKNRLDFSYSYVSNLKIENTDLSNIRLNDALFTKVSFNHVNLCGANLERSKMPWSTLHQIVADHSLWSGVDLSNSKISAFSGTKISMIWANAGSCNWDSCLISMSDLSGLNLHKSKINHSALEDCDLNGIQLDRTQIKLSQYSACQVSNNFLDKIKESNSDIRLGQSSSLTIIVDSTSAAPKTIYLLDTLSN